MLEQRETYVGVHRTEGAIIAAPVVEELVAPEGSDRRLLTRELRVGEYNSKDKEGSNNKIKTVREKKFL